MKELSIEEKAQAYDEAIKKVNDFYEGKTKLYSDVDKTLNYLFPELKESEDERIIQWIRKELEDKYVTDNIVNNEMADKALAWLEKQGKLVAYYEDKLDRCACENFNKGYKKALEKQGEQNDFAPKSAMEAIKEVKIDNANKVEPKFEVGDLITNGVLVGKIDEIYEYCGEFYYHACFGYYYSDVSDAENWHKWTIQDAKDGDVLAEDSCIFIIKKMNPNGTAIVHCCLFDDGDFDLTGLTLGFDIDSTYPATKEQRDLLFQKMKEAGYEWDDDKKELKIIDWSKHIKYEPNSPSITKEFPTWSKEDEKNFNEAISYIKDTALRNWLISFKDKVQPKQEWSKEDEEIFNELVSYFISDTFLNHTEEDIVNWLKSLKERVQSKSQWKSSDEQMDALETAVSSLQSTALESLYNELKKL